MGDAMICVQNTDAFALLVTLDRIVVLISMNVCLSHALTTGHVKTWLMGIVAHVCPDSLVLIVKKT
jgi:hypothetical protein